MSAANAIKDQGSVALNIILRDPLDGDALQYCATSGAIDRLAISAFVRGVKQLGLWNSMVCWPLRSTQNAGTGTTAYSLGGLGTFNGTLTNGPTWGADGVNFADNTTQIITTTLSPAISSDLCAFAAMQCNAGGITLNVVASFREDVTFERRATFASGWTGDTFRTIPFVASGTFQEPSLAGFTDGSYHSALYKLQVTSSPKTASVAIDGGNDTTTQDSSATLAGPDAKFCMGNEGFSATRAVSGNLPFVSFFNVVAINNVALHNLYRATLGTGLGLP
jgi:hypothetical protein